MRRIPVPQILLAACLVALLNLAGVVRSQQPGIATRSDGRAVWNNDGDFELAPFDTGDIEKLCTLDDPWGGDSWGIEGSSFDGNNLSHAIDWARFSSGGHDGYLYGKEQSNYWSLVRYIQGDVWGGPHVGCPPITWYRPPPLATYGRDLSLEIDIRRDMPDDAATLPPGGWIMFAINVWFSSPEFPEGVDANGRKPLVMDLIFYHDCNWGGCGYGSKESDLAFHYQAFIGQTPHGQQEPWTIDLNEHIQQALNYPWELTGSLAHAEDTLHLYQLEFVIELKRAEGAAYIDDFYLLLGPPPLPITDLAVARSGDSLVLNWSPVTHNVAGDPTTVETYRIHWSADDPYLTPEGAPGDTTTGTTYTHTGALGDPGTNYYYIVTAVDDLGQESAISNRVGTFHFPILPGR
jgi:hypothetical protein